MTRLLAILLLPVLISLKAHAAPYSPDAATVELHAHLFMNEGMGMLFLGDFFGPLKADDFSDKLSSQANPETVNESGIGLLVVSLYAHVLGTSDRRESVRRQIALAERFVKENPQWVIARTAGEGKAAFAAGKRVIVLALEGAAGILENENDIEEFVVRKGVRIVTLLHLTDDHLGGAAFLGGIKDLASPGAWIRSLFKKNEEIEGVKVNDKGLTVAGETLARAFLKHKVWIDVAHAPDLAQRRLLPILKEASQPLLYTHMPIRRHYKAERGIANWMLDEVAQSGGIVGVMPSEDMLGDLATGGACGDGVSTLAAQYNEVATRLGAARTVFGTDFNGGVRHLDKPKCPTRTPIDESGFWHIGQSQDLWAALRSSKAQVPARLGDSVDAFLNAWERVNP